jgi:signal transduction histidine kinase/CheY-like chemotaxis protein
MHPSSFSKEVATRILEELPDVCLYLDEKRRIVWANQTAREKLEIPEDLEPAYCYTIWTGRSDFCESCPVERAFATGERQEQILDHKEKGVWRLIAVPVKEAGSVVGVIEFAYDRTGDFQLEQSLKGSVTRAHELIAKKSMMMANVSHELRTPLNGILGFVSLLAGRITDKVSRGYLEQIKASGEKLLDIIESLLTLSSIERRSKDQNCRSFNLEHLASSLMTIYESDRGNSALSFRLEAESLPAKLTGDSDALSHILNHLLSNATKFSDSGEVCCHLASDDAGLTIQVRDRGIGIPADEVDRVFDRFYQCEQPITWTYGGMGIGLSIVREEVQQLKGTVHLVSRFREGTTVSVNLPWGPNLMKEEPEEVKKAPVKMLSGKRILIAEDETINRLFLSVLLKKAGHRVYEAVNGRQAVELAEKERPDLILMDISMPVMDGIEAASTILDIPELSAIPIIAVTAYDSEEYRGRCREAGMKGFISKPVHTDQLFKVMEELLAN